LAFRRVGADFLYDLVADVDGPVHTAILRVGDNLHEPDPGCYIVHPSLGGGRFLLEAFGHDSAGKQSESGHEGAIGGSIDELHPKVLVHYTDGGFCGWQAGAKWVARVCASDWRVYLSPWTMDKDIYVTSPPDDPEGRHVGQLVLSGDVFFWATSTLISGGINVWTPEGGARPFIRWIDDYTREAGDLGTDGVDLVWSYGEGKTEPSEEPFPIRLIVTAKFTTDPEKVKATARRLRSQPSKCIGCSGFVVGCGYAAHEGCCNNSYVVRLSDGVSWDLPGKYPDPMLDTPVGLTCEEVFVLGELDGRTTIARIRLDSLGPGTAPD
ncbi:MAG: hypothetical protein HY744_28945, partial [Deltaproteobacteria bacterium]|nr:hypothetical protein [Deltaproteobacteria bacterium]